MKYSRKERLSIGQKIYEGQFRLEEAASYYGINKYTARDYYREYKATVKDTGDRNGYAGLSKKELINEIMRLRIQLLLKEKRPVEIVHELKEDFSVTKLCKATGITRSWYYKWLKSQNVI